MRKNREIIERNKAKLPENRAKRIHNLKRRYIFLDKESAKLSHETSEVEREIRVLKHKAEDITNRAAQIRDMRERVDELKQQKGADKGVIQRIEHSCEQAGAYFEQKFGIAVELAEAEVKRLEVRARGLGNLQAKSRERVTSFDEEKREILLAYQKQKMLADISPNAREIREKLAELDEQTHVHGVKDRLARSTSQRTLDMVTEQNFHEILESLQPEQREALTQQREREKIRERFFARNR